MSAWGQVWFGFVGNILSALFLAICIALGFGPTQWAEFLISGMPLFVTPGIVRLVFLLLGSLTLTSLLWNRIVETQAIWRKLKLIITACLPFVAGSFYITAAPRPQRYLTDGEIDRLVANFSEIKSGVPTIPVVFSSGDEPAEYADKFLAVLDKADIKYIQMPGSAGPNECGVMVGTKDPPNPSIQAQKIRDALRNAGFNPRIVPFQPHFAFNYDFSLFIGPICR